ncbi:MAG TPA: GNAT family N-acetyltransferase [Cryomorphaceae bacterium]|jgi:diamine N-acetyltransferase|nr:MAG: hypothetical protein ABR98_07835 [Cryomorphaceae bacterium BACL7 MAG-120910-bin2]KRO68383.1 MAG: hypothetical protein ABR88_07245 [Cryomorphaceae bacterium BACL7 MAG-120322-bin74]KRO83988.1 MAG: hypothetical protein ABR87_05685 [Cryomorphaceae bacterium BACL7 MAG-121220-bin83]HAB31864.1 GNAT family N-acetyltransferase [Cryomorphaceae bacterium]
MVKVVLRALEPSDIEALLKWENDPAHWVVGQRSSPYSRDHLTRYVDASSRDFWEVGQVRFAVCTEEDSRPIGLVDVFGAKRLHCRAEVGLLIDPAMRGKGFGLAALKALQLWAKEFAMLETLSAQIYTDHPAAISSFKKAGFVQQGTWLRWVKTPKGYKDVSLWQWLG